MLERPPQTDSQAEAIEDVRRKKIELALELSERSEPLQFPGVRPDSYATIKAGDEEYPGYTTPIDELIKRFDEEGCKVVVIENPKATQIVIMPFESDDIENNNPLPRHLSTEGNGDDQLLELILKDLELLNLRSEKIDPA